MILKLVRKENNGNNATHAREGSTMNNELKGINQNENEIMNWFDSLQEEQNLFEALGLTEETEK